MVDQYRPRHIEQPRGRDNNNPCVGFKQEPQAIQINSQQGKSMSDQSTAPELQANIVQGKPILLTGSSHLIGNLNIKFGELVRLFGKPQECEGGKVDVIWELEFEDRYNLSTGEKDSTLAPTKVRIDIHNWKDGPNYGGWSVKDIISWTIGGNYIRDVFVLIRYLEDDGVDFNAIIPTFMVEQAKKFEEFKGSPNGSIKFV